jgi:nucleotide-binding universal stress UspA family protein
MPELVVREGTPSDVILALIDEDPDIRILVLGAATGAEGPGPLVALMAGKMAGTMHIPVTVVPGNLTESQIDELT